MSPRQAGVISLAVTLAALVFAFAAGTAQADSSSPDGPWMMTPVTETFTVQQWSPACGPAPVSGVQQPGGTVQVRSDKGELEIDGPPRTLRTDACLDAMQTLARETHSSDGHTWRTRCSTPASDPRRAVINTAYFLTSSDAIAIAETGRYEVTISGSRCIADVKRNASLRKIVPAIVPTAATAESALKTGAETAPLIREPAPIPAPAKPSPAAATRVDCSSPGDAARLEVRPSRKLLRSGESFGFRALVVDAAGCLTTTPIRWSIGPLRMRDGADSGASAPSVDGAGNLSIPVSLAGATFDVIATASGRSARSSVEVTSPANYEALLTQSGLDSNGERSEPSVALLATTSIGASGVQAEDGALRRRLLFVVVIVGLALGLGVVAIFAGLRSRKAHRVERAASNRHAARMALYEQDKREREKKHAAQVLAHKESVASAQEAAAQSAARGVDAGPMFCPSCRREFSSGSTYCPFDANCLVAIAGHKDLMSGPAGGVCPTCKRGFNPGVKVCPHDGEELVPQGAIAATASTPPAVRGKICPTCGGRFDGAAGFCGKDGTQLVLLN